MEKGKRKLLIYCKECGSQIIQMHLENCFTKSKAVEYSRNRQMSGRRSRHSLNRRTITTSQINIQNNNVRLYQSIREAKSIELSRRTDARPSTAVATCWIARVTPRVRSIAFCKRWRSSIGHMDNLINQSSVLFRTAMRTC